MRFVTIAVFLVLVVAALFIELVARARARSHRITTLADMLAEIMQSRITRVGIAAAWWWFGWHFLFAETVQLDV